MIKIKKYMMEIKAFLFLMKEKNKKFLKSQKKSLAKIIKRLK